MKPISTGISLCLIALLTSCDPSGCDEYVVQNNSSKTITVEQGALNAVDSIIAVAPGQSVAYAKECGLGKGSGSAERDNKINPQRLYRITSGDSSVSKKDIYNFSNWMHTKHKKYDYTHTLTITDADF